MNKKTNIKTGASKPGDTSSLNGKHGILTLGKIFTIEIIHQNKSNAKPYEVRSE